MTTTDASLENRSNVQVDLIAAVSILNKELNKWGLEFAGIVYDPEKKRADGKLEMYAVQNIPDARADLLLEGYMAIRADSESHQVEDYHHIANHSTVQ
jgi:hypothetical protein